MIGCDMPLYLGFITVHDGARNQIAGAIAETQASLRKRDDIVIRRGGLTPNTGPDRSVVDVMGDLGYDLSTQSPTRITQEELGTLDIAVLPGDTLSISDMPPGLIVHDWDGIARASGAEAEIRMLCLDIEQRVVELFRSLPSQAHRAGLRGYSR
jgi:protein-tyrosine-phosphatase